MKKLITFKKSISFPTMIGEITSISLDHDLHFIDESNIVGNFEVSGSYKLTEASRIEEPFTYKLPAEIVLVEKLEKENSKVEVDDFYYEIEQDENLICHIDVLVEGVEQIELVEEELLHEQDIKIDSIIIEKDDLRECDGDKTYKKEEEKLEEKEAEIVEETDHVIEQETKETTEKEELETNQMEEEKTNVGSLFSSLADNEETFSTYAVYIIRQEETINSLIEKYHTTKEELESYNDLQSLSIGSKIIIPLANEQD